MFYRENGQFKTNYRDDQQVFPILQDRIAIGLLLVVAFIAVPMLASDYLFRAILIPFVIMSLAALGVNILVGYCGQISLGSGAFMAVGAYSAYNIFERIPGMPLIPALILGGLCATAFGILFGLPSLRVKGLYLAVATLAAQFFRSHRPRVDGDPRHGRRSRRHRDSPHVRQAQRLRGQLLHHRRRWGVVGFHLPRSVGARRFLFRPLLSLALHGDHRRPRLHHGQLFWCSFYCGFTDCIESVFTFFCWLVWHRNFDCRRVPCRVDDFWWLDRLVSDCGTTRAGQTMVDGQTKIAPVAFSALIFTCVDGCYFSGNF